MTKAVKQEFAMEALTHVHLFGCLSQALFLSWLQSAAIPRSPHLRSAQFVVQLVRVLDHQTYARPSKTTRTGHSSWLCQISPRSF